MVFVLVLPLSALVARIFLWFLARLESASGAHTHHGLRYAALVASSAVPLAWFVSASLHQAEDGRSETVCAAEHAPEAFCAETAFFSLMLCLLGVALSLRQLVRERHVARPSTTVVALAQHMRIDEIVRRFAELAPLRAHSIVSDSARSTIATMGILSPRVVVRTAFAESLDDEALAAALHHELQHFCHRDPLRYFIASWARAVNPLGWWMLRNEHARWLFEREADCDKQAVLSGASPVALAQALIVAARPGHASLSPALGAGHIEAVKLRLGLLLAYADQLPTHCKHGPTLRILATGLLLILVLPHGGGTEPLDTIHTATERAALLIVGP